MRAAFTRRAPPSASEDGERALAHGEYVLKEVQALIRLHRYRSLKKMYDSDFAFHEQRFHKILVDAAAAVSSRTNVPVVAPSTSSAPTR